jgi:hypothetical protein
MALWDGFGGVVERRGRTIISYYVKVSGCAQWLPRVGTGCAVGGWSTMLFFLSTENTQLKKIKSLLCTLAQEK